MYPSNERIVETLESNFPLKAYNLINNDPELDNYNYFLYGATGLRRTSSCKYMQVVSIRAILDPIIPENFEFDVVEKMEEIGLALSNSEDITYDIAMVGNTDKFAKIVEFTFLRPFKRV